MIMQALMKSSSTTSFNMYTYERMSTRTPGNDDWTYAGEPARCVLQRPCHFFKGPIVKLMWDGHVCEYPFIFFAASFTFQYLPVRQRLMDCFILHAGRGHKPVRRQKQRARGI